MRRLRVDLDSVFSAFLAFAHDPHLAAEALKAASVIVVAGSTDRWTKANYLSNMLRATLMHVNSDGKAAKNFGICGNGLGAGVALKAATVYYTGEGVKWPLEKQIGAVDRPDVVVVTSVARMDRRGWKLMERLGLPTGRRLKLTPEEDSVSLILGRRYSGTYDWHSVLDAVSEN